LEGRYRACSSKPPFFFILVILLFRTLSITKHTHTHKHTCEHSRVWGCESSCHEELYRPLYSKSLSLALSFSFPSSTLLTFEKIYADWTALRTSFVDCISFLFFYYSSTHRWRHDRLSHPPSSLSFLHVIQCSGSAHVFVMLQCTFTWNGCGALEIAFLPSPPSCHDGMKLNIWAAVFSSAHARYTQQF